MNMQVNLYLLSRVLAASAKLAAAAVLGPDAVPTQGQVFPWFAAAVWGAVLWLYEHRATQLQPSLLASMRYLFADSARWSGVRDYILGSLP